jgi:hypothetical protein
VCIDQSGEIGSGQRLSNARMDRCSIPQNGRELLSVVPLYRKGADIGRCCLGVITSIPFLG